MTDQAQTKNNKVVFILTGIIVVMAIIISFQSYWLYGPDQDIPKEHFGKEYQQKQDSADNVLKNKDSDIKRFDDKRTIRDSIRWIDRPKEKKQHEEINNLIDSTRIIWWKDLFRANGVY